jgi:hypothetical protein
LGKVGGSGKVEPALIAATGGLGYGRWAMRRVVAACVSIVVSAAASQAIAGETQCWIDNGAVVVPAAFGGIAGDFILDLSAPRTQLHLTTAQTNGLAPPGPVDPSEAQGVVTLAGEHIPARIAIADLDAREWGFPTSLDGIIGADVLSGYVVDLQFSPCRLTLQRRASTAEIVARLPTQTVSGVPTFAATVSDGVKTRTGPFAIDTGSAGVRLVAAHARFSRLSAQVDPMSRDRPPARLATLSFGGLEFHGLPAALQTDGAEGVLGGVGTDVWSRYVLRLDLRRGQLELISAPRSARSGDSSRTTDPRR